MHSQLTLDPKAPGAVSPPETLPSTATLPKLSTVESPNVPTPCRTGAGYQNSFGVTPSSVLSSSRTTQTPGRCIAGDMPFERENDGSKFNLLADNSNNSQSSIPEPQVPQSPDQTDIPPLTDLTDSIESSARPK